MKVKSNKEKLIELAAKEQIDVATPMLNKIFEEKDIPKIKHFGMAMFIHGANWTMEDSRDDAQ